jgi:hypothetical protein
LIDPDALTDFDVKMSWRGDGASPMDAPIPDRI